MVEQPHVSIPPGPGVEIQWWSMAGAGVDGCGSSESSDNWVKPPVCDICVMKFVTLVFIFQYRPFAKSEQLNYIVYCSCLGNSITYMTCKEILEPRLIEFAHLC